MSLVLCDSDRVSLLCRLYCSYCAHATIWHKSRSYWPSVTCLALCTVYQSLCFSVFCTYVTHFVFIAFTCISCTQFHFNLEVHVRVPCAIRYGNLEIDVRCSRTANLSYLFRFVSIFNYLFGTFFFLSFFFTNVVLLRGFFPF